MAGKTQTLSVSIHLPGSYSHLDTGKKWAKVMQTCTSCASPLVLLMEKFGELNTRSLLANPGHVMTGGWYCSKCGLHIMPGDENKSAGAPESGFPVRDGLTSPMATGKAGNATSNTADIETRYHGDGLHGDAGPSGTSRSAPVGVGPAGQSRQGEDQYDQWEAHLRSQFSNFLASVREHFRVKERQLSDQQASLERRHGDIQRQEASLKQRLDKVKVTETELQDRIQMLNNYKQNLVQQAKEQLRQWKSTNGSPIKAESRILDSIFQTVLGNPDNHKDSVESGYSSGCASSPDKAINGERIRMGLGGLRHGAAVTAPRQSENRFQDQNARTSTRKVNEPDSATDARGNRDQRPDNRSRDVISRSDGTPQLTSPTNKDSSRQTVVFDRRTPGKESGPQAKVDPEWRMPVRQPRVLLNPDTSRDLKGHSRAADVRDKTPGWKGEDSSGRSARLALEHNRIPSPEKRSTSTGREAFDVRTPERNLAGNASGFPGDRRAKSAERRPDRFPHSQDALITPARSFDNLLRPETPPTTRSTFQDRDRSPDRKPLSPKKQPTALSPRRQQDRKALTHHHGNVMAAPWPYSVERPRREALWPGSGDDRRDGGGSGSWRLARPLKGRRSRSAGNVHPMDLLTAASRDNSRGHRSSSWDVLGNDKRPSHQANATRMLLPDSRHQPGGPRHDPKYASSRDFPDRYATRDQRGLDSIQMPRSAAPVIRAPLLKDNPLFRSPSGKDGPPDMTSTPKRDRSKRETSPASRNTHGREVGHQVAIPSRRGPLNTIYRGEEEAPPAYYSRERPLRSHPNHNPGGDVAKATASQPTPVYQGSNRDAAVGFHRDGSSSRNPATSLDQRHPDTSPNKRVKQDTPKDDKEINLTRLSPLRYSYHAGDPRRHPDGGPSPGGHRSRDALLEQESRQRGRYPGDLSQSKSQRGADTSGRGVNEYSVLSVSDRYDDTDTPHQGDRSTQRRNPDPRSRQNPERGERGGFSPDGLLEGDPEGIASDGRLRPEKGRVNPHPVAMSSPLMPRSRTDGIRSPDHGGQRQGFRTAGTPDKENRVLNDRSDDAWRSPREMTSYKRRGITANDRVLFDDEDGLDILGVAPSSDARIDSITSPVRMSRGTPHRKPEVKAQPPGRGVTESPSRSPVKRMTGSDGAEQPEAEGDAGPKRKKRPALTPLWINRNPPRDLNFNSNNNNNSDVIGADVSNDVMDDLIRGDINDASGGDENFNPCAMGDNTLTCDFNVSNEHPGRREQEERQGVCTCEDGLNVSSISQSSRPVARPPPPLTKPKPVWAKDLVLSTRTSVDERKVTSPGKRTTSGTILAGNGTCFASDTQV